PRAAAIAGILFALLLTAALVLVRVGAPPDSGDTGAWLTDPSSRRLVALALNLVPFAGIAFLWFIGVVRDRIGQREDRFFATVFWQRAAVCRHVVRRGRLRWRADRRCGGGRRSPAPTRWPSAARSPDCCC